MGVIPFPRPQSEPKSTPDVATQGASVVDALIRETVDALIRSPLGEKTVGEAFAGLAQMRVKDVLREVFTVDDEAN
ncbi:hypothetical protein [Mycobacterium marinum]|uniref:hypothetical protein n=1 Tax=Mycobacterium marinum TaxID=1781 RepID=UPI0021C28D61|nr:hypothetical protein [Mycobacterium marinum]GJO42011.1 hypothetical protein NJB1604_15210 [Mycobacterium marinum]